MRKQYNSPLASIALILTLIIGLYGCSNEDENSNQNDVSQFTFRVTDGGYSDHDATGSRAIEENYTTTFTAGDCIGLFSVKNNTIIDSNIPLTLGEDGTWTGKTYYEGTDVQYYAYYPYQAILNTRDLDLSAVNDDVKFFTSVIQDWTPSKDQSDYATGYTSSDLMTGVSSPSTNPDGTHNLNITLTHRMAMVVINLPMGKYRLSTDANYTWTIIAPNEIGFNDFIPYSINSNSFRYLVKPATGTTLLGSYQYAGNGKSDYEITANIPSSKYQNYIIDGTTVSIPHVLQAGDYYLNDGSIVGKNVALTKTQQTACIGIVFYAGKHSTDASNYSRPLFSGAACIGNNNIHGYVVALTDVDVAKKTWESPASGVKIGMSEIVSDWNGYSNQARFHTVATMGNFAALSLSEKYGTTPGSTDYAAPQNSSGWFLPSVGQLHYLSQQTTNLSVKVIDLGTSLGKANIKWFLEMEYWSSTESGGSFFAGTMNFQSKTPGSRHKTNISNYIRSICAF